MRIVRPAKAQKSVMRPASEKLWAPLLLVQVCQQMYFEFQRRVL